MNKHDQLFIGTAALSSFCVVESKFSFHIAYCILKPTVLFMDLQKTRMVVTSTSGVQYGDRKSEVKAFDDSKTGVKGLIDAGVAKIPSMFVHNQIKSEEKSDSTNSDVTIPIIDFKGVNNDAVLRGEIISKVRDACEKWGFFQAINHGIPESVMEEMIEGVHGFHEQDSEVKKQFYSRDETRKFLYNCNFDLHQAPAANWRDTMSCVMAPHPPEYEELPGVCRYVIG